MTVSVIEFALIAFTVLGYAVEFEIPVIHHNQSRYHMYLAYFLIILMTLSMQLLYSIYDDVPNGRVLELSMAACVVGPIHDMIFSSVWPGNGASMFVLAQLIFVIEASPTPFSGITLGLVGATAFLMYMAWTRHGMYRVLFQSQEQDVHRSLIKPL